MASSSRSYQPLKNSNNTTEEQISFVEEELKASKAGQEEEEEWLKLGLGLGTSCKKIVGDHHVANPVLVSPSSSSSSSLSLSSQIGLGLGFERGSGLLLGPKKANKGLGSGMVEIMEHSDNYYSNNLLGWPSSDHCYNGHYSHHNDDHGTMLWPSSCQLQIDPPPPCDSHHYNARNNNPHQSGVWFTLRSSTNR